MVNLIKFGKKNKACQHPFALRDYHEAAEPINERHSVCSVDKGGCGHVLGPWTDIFRKFLRHNQAVKLRRGTVSNVKNGQLVGMAGFAVGVRFVIPESPGAVRRVWLAVADRRTQKDTAMFLLNRMRISKCDEEYNAVINEFLDLVRDENPDIEEQVVGAEDDEQA